MRRSIRMKLIGTVIPLIALSIISILCINFFSTKAIVIEATYERLIKESNVNVKRIEGWAERILSSLNAVQSTLENVHFSDENQRLKYLKTTQGLNESFPAGVHLADETGYWQDPSGYQPGSKYSVVNQEWYKEGVANETFAFGKPYFESSVGNTGGYVVSATAKIKGQKTQMVAAATIELNQITEMIDDIQVLETGYCFLMDRLNNKIIAHADPSWNASTLFENDSNPLMANVAILLKQRDYSVHSISGQDAVYFTKLEEIPNTTWVLVSLVTEASVLGDLKQLKILYLGMGILAVLLSTLVIWGVISRIIDPIKGLTEILTEITKGNFTVRIKEKGADEIAVMSQALKHFIEVMKTMIGEINGVSDELKKQAENGAGVSHTLEASASQQSEAMLKTKFILRELADSIEEMTSDATKLATVVTHTTRSSVEAKDKIKQSVEMTEQNRLSMGQLQQEIQLIMETINDLQQTVMSVGTSTTEINSIINVMGHIASETKLLSLNASIEAARAGEVGKGFAVVARGVGDLAVSSATSATKVSKMIKKINEQIEGMIQQTKESTRYIESNVAQIDEACRNFEVIYKNITKTSQVINEMMLEMQQVDKVAVNMAAITEEQVASAQEILVNVEELTTYSQRVTEDSRLVARTGGVISEAATTLYEDMKRFKL